MSLSVLQGDFRDWLETGAEAASDRFPLTAQAGLLVYQNNYRASLMACLEESFPQTLAWIGGQSFRSIAATLIDARPPDSWSLDHYAAHFPPALAASLPGDPEVAELAMLEQALAEAFVGPDAAALTTDHLLHIDWDAATLRLVPTARLLTLATNAAAVWSALTSHMEPPPAALLREPATLLIWRADFTSCFRSLDPREGEMLSEIRDGLTFADICSRLVADLGEANGISTAGQWLARWAADGLMTVNMPGPGRLANPSDNHS